MPNLGTVRLPDQPDGHAQVLGPRSDRLVLGDGTAAPARIGRPTGDQGDVLVLHKVW